MNTPVTRLRRASRPAVAVAATLTLGFLLPAPASADDVAGYAPEVQDAAVSSLTSEGSLDEVAAKRKLSTQAESARTVDQLVGQLGTRHADGFLDEQGNPVVNVLDEADAALVRQAGAIPKTVEYSAAELDAARTALDSVPTVTHTAIGFDPSHNEIVLTVAEAAPEAPLSRLLDVAEAQGDAVRVDHVPGEMSIAVLGGEAIEGGGTRCSAGFNGNKGGTDYNVTAGHCTKAVAEWDIGPSEDAQFPGTDMGLIKNTTGDAPGAVTMYDGSTQKIASAKEATVGQEVCKSGSTTNLTCGGVTELGVSVNYAEGTVDNLVKTDATVDKGDSGGCLFSGETAVGITSGMDDGGNSYFQPAKAALSNYGVQLN